jgi:hypothetical protein
MDRYDRPTAERCLAASLAARSTRSSNLPQRHARKSPANEGGAKSYTMQHVAYEGRRAEPIPPSRPCTRRPKGHIPQPGCPETWIATSPAFKRAPVWYFGNQIRFAMR